jgi:hypothetical protein
MVLPDEIRSARQEGEIQTVVAWLDANEYANDDLATLLTDICFDHHITEADVDIARLLLSRGVDANYCEHDDGWTLLHTVVSFSHNEYARTVTTALIGAGADVNARADTEDGDPILTPLGTLLDNHICRADRLHHCLESATLLLRAGASLDACSNDDSAEDFMFEAEDENDDLASDPNFVALKTLVAGVRRAGSWKLWTLEDVKALLRLRSLVARGRARERKVRTRRRTPQEIALLLAPAFPNELFWKVMEYWNPRV